MLSNDSLSIPEIPQAQKEHLNTVKVKSNQGQAQVAKIESKILSAVF